MSNLTKLDQLLKSQPIRTDSIESTQLLDYADNISRMRECDSRRKRFEAWHPAGCFPASSALF